MERKLFVPNAEREIYAIVSLNWRYIYYKDSSEEFYNVKENTNEWYNLAGDRMCDPIIEEMKKSAPQEFAPSATPRNELNLVVEENSFHWERKTKN